MSYLVLARKYRPQVFSDVVGQDQVTTTLGHAVTSGRVAHAYLFCGPRGVGKTTAARILAKALNCETARAQDPPSAVPCNECGPCRSITTGSSLEVLEIDGASNRGINEVRELRENTRYAPSDGATKVYIIDEVHMLTNEAFNALLKTLEEPPSAVIFVLATTEPFKVPGTILSRCQRFDFARIPTRDISAHLEAILAREDVQAAPDAVSLVARRARGGLRDALSLMDQVLSAADGPVDRERVETTLGLVGEDVFFDLAEAVADGNPAAALERLHAVYSGGADLGEVAEGLAYHFRDLALLRMEASLEDLLEAAATDPDRYRTQAARFEPDALQDLLERAARTAAELRRSEHPRLALEVSLAEMTRAAHAVPLGELGRRLLDLERHLGGDAPAPARPSAPVRSARAPERSAKPAPGKPAPPSASPEAAAAAPAARDLPAEASPPATGAADDAVALWRNCLEDLKKANIRLWGTLSAVPVQGWNEDGALVLDPARGGVLAQEALRETETRGVLLAALERAGMARPRLALAGEAASGKGAGPAKKGKGAPRSRTGSAAKATGAKAEGAKPRSAKSGSAKPAAGKPAAKTGANPDEDPPDDAPSDERSMGQIFKDEPKLKKVMDLFDGEVLP